MSQPRLSNEGRTIYEAIAGLQIPASLRAKPYLLPVYDEPEFILRNIYRLLGGWYSGIPSELKPAPVEAQAREITNLAGGVEHLVNRAKALAAQGNLTLACHLVDWAVAAEPANKAAHEVRSDVYERRTAAESSTMSKGVFGAAARDSKGRSRV